MLNLGLLATSAPVVIGQRLPVAVMQFQDWIHETARDGLAIDRYRRAHGAGDDAPGPGTFYNKTGDTNFVSSLSNDASGDV